MPVKEVRLNGKKIARLDDLYDELARQLSFPEHFGRNLDALLDTLSNDIEGPITVVWQYADRSKGLLGRDFPRVMQVFHQVMEERDDFRLTLHS